MKTFCFIACWVLSSLVSAAQNEPPACRPDIEIKKQYLTLISENKAALGLAEKVLSCSDYTLFSTQNSDIWYLASFQEKVLGFKYNFPSVIDDNFHRLFFPFVKLTKNKSQAYQGSNLRTIEGFCGGTLCTKGFSEKSYIVQLYLHADSYLLLSYEKENSTLFSNFKDPILAYQSECKTTSLTNYLKELQSSTEKK